MAFLYLSVKFYGMEPFLPPTGTYNSTRPRHGQLGHPCGSFTLWLHGSLCWLGRGVCGDETSSAGVSWEMIQQPLVDPVDRAQALHSCSRLVLTCCCCAYLFQLAVVVLMYMFAWHVHVHALRRGHASSHITNSLPSSTRVCKHAPKHT